MIKIKKVTITGDMVEVKARVNGRTQRIRRNVQGYELLSDDEKKALWNDIVGITKTEYHRLNIFKSLWKRLTR